MERESFENEEVARIINERFVSIKVDREERPDVDRVYVSTFPILFPLERLSLSLGTGNFPVELCNYSLCKG